MGGAGEGGRGPLQVDDHMQPIIYCLISCHPFYIITSITSITPCYCSRGLMITLGGARLMGVGWRWGSLWFCGGFRWVLIYAMRPRRMAARRRMRRQPACQQLCDDAILDPDALGRGARRPVHGPVTGRFVISEQHVAV